MEKRFDSFQVPVVPAALVVLYAHDAQKFDQLVPDYEALVGRIRVPH
jgi:hypothetical protein